MKPLVLLPVVTALLLALPAVALPPGHSPGRTRSVTERIEPEHLETASADAARYEAERVSRDLMRPLHDYRAAVHVHADDSDHTGGTLEELLDEAKRAEVSVVMLSDHYRPPRDFMQGWRGLREGVLFIPGCEGKGFLLYPDASVMNRMEESKEELIAATNAGTGLIFLSHVERRLDHAMAGLTGMEIYNRHYDAEDDMSVILPLSMALTDPRELSEMQAALDAHHEAFLACQVDYPSAYIGKWDRETQQRRLTGVGAIDCHHNQVFVLRMRDAETVLFGTIVDSEEDMRPVPIDVRPGLAEMVKGHQPGDIVAKLDLDTYYHSFRTMSTHVLATELTEAAVRAALREGHAYVSFDWMCDPTGFAYQALNHGERVAVMGEEAPLAQVTALEAAFPVACKIRLIHDGRVLKEAESAEFRYVPEAPGVYRIEAWLTIDGEERPWILSNPIYLR